MTIVKILTAAALAGCATAAGARDPAGSEAGDGPYLYVTNQEAATVSVIDVDDRQVVETIDLQALGFSPNAKPHDTAVEPDGSHWYVSLIGENKVLRFNRGNDLVATYELEVPGLIVFDGMRDRLWVGRSMTAVNPPASIGVINPADGSVEEIEVLFPRPHALAIAPQAGVVYVGSLAENRIAVVDAETGEAHVIDVPGEHVHTLVQFALSPDGHRLVVGGEMSGELLVFDVSEPAEPVLVNAVELGGAPWDPVYTPDGRFVFVPLNRDDAVAVLDTSTWQVVDTIESEALAQPHGSAISPDGERVFVSNRNTAGTWPGGGTPPEGNVLVIDAATHEILGVLKVGQYAAGMETVPPR